MLARAESHIRIEQNDLFVRFGRIVYPFGHDDDTSQPNGPKMLFPYVDPVVPVHFALGILQRSEGKRAAAHFLCIRHVAHNLPDGFLRNVLGNIALYQNVFRLSRRQIVVHIIPIHRILAFLQSDDIVDVADRDAVVGIIPHDVRNDFTRFRRRMYGQFDKFHKYLFVYYIINRSNFQPFRANNSPRQTISFRKAPKNRLPSS